MNNKNGEDKDKTIHCFFSGGRDSALACYIAHRVAQLRRWAYRLIHIDTTIGIKQTREYVKRYAEWLGAELVVLRPERTFKEYAEKYAMWPSLYPPKFRWCYRELKLKPLTKYIHENYKNNDIIVMGIRRDESDFRKKFYTSTFFVRDYDGVKALVWAPLLYVDEAKLVSLLERFNVPRNPVWRFGFSGECLCLAGAPEYEIGLILRNFPEEREVLLDIDDIINRNRKSRRPSAPFRLAQSGYRTLREYYEKTAKLQVTLDNFIFPYGGCEGGSCMLL
jgi:3'-phosphoadenosine 5'-phosphosulfate sulfotransferase (PAPS reductase)/FAD synthetase